MIKLGIVTAESSYGWMRQAETDICQKAGISWLIYDSLAMLQEKYPEFENTVDGVLFSGQLPHDHLIYSGVPITCPSDYCNVNEGDLYKLLAKIAVTNPECDFSRIYISVGIAPPLEDVFPPEKCPVVDEFAKHFERALFPVDSELYKSVINRYLELWNSRRFQLIITRFTNMSVVLQQHNIPFMLLHPSRQSITESADKLILKITRQRLDNSLTACILVALHSGMLSENTETAAMRYMHDALNKYNARKSMAYIIHAKEDMIELITTNQDFRSHTGDYTSFELPHYLQRQLGQQVLCGVGIGENHVIARNRALQALREVRHTPEHTPLIITNTNQIIGPDDPEKDAKTYGISEDMMQMAAKIEMSPFNLQGIAEILKKTGSNQITSQELAANMGIRQRSATRILSKLEHAGCAHMVESRRIHRSGRPVKVYEINLRTCIHKGRVCDIMVE